MTDCACYCHVNPGATCTIDDGSSGVPGKPYCGAHTSGTASMCVLEHVEPTDTYIGYLCRRHYHWVTSTLDQIKTLAALLPDVTQPGQGSDVKTSGGSVESPAPGRLDVMALSDRRAATPVDLEPGDVPNVAYSLIAWVHLVFLERGIRPPDWFPRRPAGPACDQTVNGLCAHASCILIRAADNRRTVSRDWTWRPRSARWVITEDIGVLCGILNRERRWVAQQLWVDDYARELGALHRVLASAVGDSMWPKPIGVCPNCQARLFVTVGVDEVSCTRCRASWRGVDLVRLRLILENDEQRRAGLRLAAKQEAS